MGSAVGVGCRGFAGQLTTTFTYYPQESRLTHSAARMTTPKTLRSWFDGHTKLLRLERASEKEEFDLLTSEKVKRGQTKLLERMGISIGGLGVRSTNIGLGGKT